MQSSGAFCVNDERSLAFFLCKSGYDVWLGNNRGYFKPKHHTLKPSHPKFWAWNIRQMACLDLPAMVLHVQTQTGREKVGASCDQVDIDCVDCTLTRDNTDFPCPRKGSSSPPRSIIIMFRSPCTSSLRRDPPKSISILIRQNYV